MPNWFYLPVTRGMTHFQNLQKLTKEFIFALHHCWAFKDVLSLLMICVYMFIFTSGSSALLECPHCGLLIWLSLLAIFNTLFWVYANFFFHEKMDKTWEYWTSAILIWYENGCWRLLGMQSINSERASLRVKVYITVPNLLRLGFILRSFGQANFPDHYCIVVCSTQKPGWMLRMK